jgi:hypothetical protein
MRALALAAALTAMTGAASAQNGDPYVGTWAFQTQPYEAGQAQVMAIMSGVAVITDGAGDRYDIKLLAQEYITQGQQSLTLTARENCQGEVQDGQFSVTCALAEPLEGYQPDSFVLQQGEADEMLGVLASASSAQVTFSRLR